MGFNEKTHAFIAARYYYHLTRRFGSRVYIEMEIAMNGDMTLSQSHAIAEQVHADVEQAFPAVKHIMIHVNPTGEARE